MSMQPWERKIVEYRPNIGMDQEILTKIIKRTNDEVGHLFKPTVSLMTRQAYFATDIIDSLLATLSALNELKTYIERTLAHTPVYIAYKKEVDAGNHLDAEEIHEENMIDIGGTPELDVYPIIVDLIEEVIVYLDYVNEELFDGEVDYSDTADLREEERLKIEALFQLEAEELTLSVKPIFTPAQQVLIDRLIADQGNDINTVEQYIEYLYQEKREQGASTIDYRKLNDESRTIVSLLSKADMFKEATTQTQGYIGSSLSAFVNNDVQGSLEYLVEMAGSLHDLKTSYEVSHQHHAVEALQSFHNSVRVSDRGVREMLDKNLSALRQKKSQVVNSLSYQLTTDQDSIGAHSIISTARDGIHSVNNLWTFILTEHMGTSEMNQDQYKKLMGGLLTKRSHQALFMYADLVQREFDFENKDRELKTFASIQNLHSRW